MENFRELLASDTIGIERQAVFLLASVEGSLIDPRKSPGKHRTAKVPGRIQIRCVQMVKTDVRCVEGRIRRALKRSPCAELCF